jgi:1-acyl-sn-glycerol-3-phosphate acyltransferase
MLMIAEKYRKYAINRWFVKQLNCIWIDRYSADLVAVRTALNWLKQGGALALAPEGTRSRTGALIEAHSGSSYLAAKSGVPVLPVGITGTEDKVVSACLKRLRRTHVTIQVGKPFRFPPVKGRDREEILQSYTDEIMCRIAALLPPAYHGFYAGHPRIQELVEG